MALELERSCQTHGTVSKLKGKSSVVSLTASLKGPLSTPVFDAGDGLTKRKTRTMIILFLESCHLESIQKALILNQNRSFSPDIRYCRHGSRPSLVHSPASFINREESSRREMLSHLDAHIRGQQLDKSSYNEAPM